ncbi:MAG: hypothetical protein KGH71_02260 [Candidatus Micrarchaeota archaeon]|nr:hypothetical protein [Candidatus Micrarchaeota archaeon]
METKEKIYSITSPSLLERGNVTEGMQRSFVDASRTEGSEEGTGKQSLIALTNRMQSLMRKADEGLMSRAYDKDIINFYPVDKEMQRASEVGSIARIYDEGFKWLEKFGEVGFEYTTLFENRMKASIVLDHGGVMTKVEGKIKYVELEKSMAIFLNAGSVGIVNSDAITVTFKPV